MKICLSRGLLAFLCLALPAGWALAQDAAHDDAGSSQPTTADRMLSEMLKPSSNSAASPATRPDAPQVLEPAGYRGKAAPSPLLREGTNLIAQHGYLRKVPDSPYSQFVFDSDAQLHPMLVLPNLQLMSMEDAASATRKKLYFTVSGMVTEYGGRNYLLLESGPDDISRYLPTPPAMEASSKGPASADQMLNEMLSAEKPSATPLPSPPMSQTDLSSGSAAVAPRAPVLSVLPEQAQIFDRICRLRPTSDGMHEQLVFDSDGRALDDPPLIILPNLKLADVQKTAQDPHIRLRVTGIVTEYRGRNYILLQKVVLMSDADRQF